MTTFSAEFNGVQGKFIGTLTGFTDQFGNKTVTIGMDSAVFISVVEMFGTPGTISQTPIIGAADNLTVINICPLANGNVQVVIDTGWTGGPINLRLSIAVDPA